MTTPRILFATLLLAASPLAAQDQLVQQALDKIASVETRLPALADGDATAANKLLADLKWAQKRLNAAYKKDTSHWQDASKRLAAADQAIRQKAAATSGGTPPAPGKTDKPDKPDNGKASPAPTAGGKPAAGNTAGPVIGEQFARLQQLDKEVNNGFANLKLLNKGYMGDAFRVGSTQKEIDKLKKRLAEFPNGDQNVQVVTKNLAQFEELFTKWQTEYQADRAAAGELTTKLDAIAAKYASQSVPGPISWPFEREKLTIWASRTKRLLDEVPADVAVLESAAGNSMVGKQAKNLLHWVGRTIPQRLQEQVEQVQYSCNRAVDDALRMAKGLREIRPDDRQAIVNRVLGEGALERSMESLQKGLEAVDMAAALDGALEVNDAPDRRAQRGEIDGTIEAVRKLAKSALAEVRMPKPVAVDAETLAKLAKIAQETLAKKKYGANRIEQLVVTSKLSRKEKTEGDVRGTVTGATVTTYHYVWDEFHVVTAEQVGDELWVFHNLLKYYHSSDSVTPQDEWILSRRFQSTQILAENVSK